MVTVRAKDPDTNVLSAFSETVRFTVPGDSTIPGTLQNLEMYASFQNVLFVFDNGTDLDLATYEYELYEEDDIVNPNTPPYALQSGSTPLSTGGGNSSVFAVPVTGSFVDENGDVQQKNFFGRVRAKDTSGNTGAWTSIVKTDPSTPLIDSQYIVSLTADKIKAGEIESAAIVLGGANPTNTIIKSKTYDTSSGAQGWYIRGDGHFSLGGPNGITYNNSTITIGSAVNVNAELNANSLTVGNGSYGYLTVDENIGPTNTDFGIELGDPEYNYWYANGKFSVGNNTNYVRWNGTSLSVVGQVTASSGTIGGWSINPSYIRSNNNLVTMNSNGLFEIGTAANNKATITSDGDFTVYGTGGGVDDGVTRMYGGYLNVKKGSDSAADIANTQITHQNIGFFKPGIPNYGIFISGGNDSNNAYIDVGATGITENNSVSCSGFFRSSGNSGWYNQTHGGGIWMDEGTTVKVYADKHFSTGGTISGGTISSSGAVYASNYFRSYGATGWYNETYGGGIYMDESTTVKVYANKNFYTAGTITAGLFWSSGTIYLDAVGPSSSDEVMVRISTGEVKKRTLSPWSLREMKEDINTLENAIDKIKSMQPRTFRFKQSALIQDEPYDAFNRREQLQYGFIVDEVADSEAPNLVYYATDDGVTKFEKSWKPDGMIALAVAAIKELTDRVEELESRMV